MNSFLRYFGAICIVACAFMLARSYSSYLKRRERECECFLLLIERLENMIRCYLTPIKDIFSGFECSEGAVMAFVKEVRSGSSPRDAFAKEERRLAIGSGGKKILSELFSGLGRGYKDGVASAVSIAHAEMEKYIVKESAEGEKNSKLIAALLLGGAVGVLLLFL